MSGRGHGMYGDPPYVESVDDRSRDAVDDFV